MAPVKYVKHFYQLDCLTQLEKTFHCQQEIIRAIQPSLFSEAALIQHRLQTERTHGSMVICDLEYRGNPVSGSDGWLKL